MSIGTVFSAEASRLLRTEWGDRIYEFQGTDEKTGKPRYVLRNPGVQNLAEEVYSLLNSRNPIVTNEPVTFVNKGEDAAVVVTNTSSHAPAIRIQNSGSSITIGPDGLVLTRRGEEDTRIDGHVMRGLANRLDQLTTDVFGNVVMNRDGCNRITRAFRMDTYLAEGGQGEGDLVSYDIETNDWVPSGRRFALTTYFFTGALLPGDLALAQWDCDSQAFHLTGSGHTYIRGILTGPLLPFNNATAELDGGAVVAIHDGFGVTSPIPGGTMVAACWNKQLKRWEKT